MERRRTDWGGGVDVHVGVEAFGMSYLVALSWSVGAGDVTALVSSGAEFLEVYTGRWGGQINVCGDH